MIVQYGDNLEYQRFSETAKNLYELGAIKTNSKEVIDLGNIEDPILALDGVGLSKLPYGNLIHCLFTGREFPLGTEYDGTVNYWHKHDRTWPPAIDTLVHLAGQRKALCLKQAEHVLDVACGTGIAGGYAANKNPNIKLVHFSDIEPNALYSVCKNSDILDRKNITSFERNDALKGMDQNYDVIIASAIPATQTYPGIQRPINPLFEGTQILEDLLRDAPKRLNKGGKLILSHSSVGDKAFDKFAEKYGARVDNVLNEKMVPFRVEFLDDQNWVDYLVEQGGMKKLDERGYPYWHTQRVKEISFA